MRRGNKERRSLLDFDHVHDVYRCSFVECAIVVWLLRKARTSRTTSFDDLLSSLG